jgi:hypothetical protein
MIRLSTLFVGFLIIAIEIVTIDAAFADDWMLRVETSGRTCHVQLKTASPLGADFKGPFPSRPLACAEARNQYDSASTDSTKCWAYGSGTIDGCKKDGVTLPSNSLEKK